jgi:hypothetical protein
VSSDLRSSTRSTSHSSVLLVEQYDALAAAIRSALKKFAPQHAINTVRSLAEAEMLASTDCPALFESISIQPIRA